MTSLFSNHSFHKCKFAFKCNGRPKKGQIRLVGRCGSLWVVPGFSNYGGTGTRDEPLRTSVHGRLPSAVKAVEECILYLE